MTKKRIADEVIIEEYQPDDIIEHSINEYGRMGFYALYSGGKDSIAILHWFSTNYPELFKGVLYIDTTVGLNETIDFVKSTCKESGWPLFIRKPPRETYEQWVLKYGFPSARIHTIVMRRLKYEAMRGFIREDIRINDAPAMLTGVRIGESTRRFRNLVKSNDVGVNKDGRMVFVAPFMYKSTKWIWKYNADNNLKVSPVHDILQISGDCLCGCFADPNEMGLLKEHYPYMYNKLRNLETKLQHDGTDKAKEYATWGNKNSIIKKRKQDITENLVCSDCKVRMVDEIVERDEK